MILTSKQVENGRMIPPVKRLFLMSSEDWEDFIEEWVQVRKSKGIYHSLERLGGANDKGRDVCAYYTDPAQEKYTWDCFQCKHYGNALTPTDVYIEIGKIIYYSFIGAYPVPNNYYFIAPKGIGVSLSDYLKNPSKNLKNSLLKNWDIHCRDKILKGVPLDLSLMSDLYNYICNFDYTIFRAVKPLEIIEEHKSHPNHIQLFGGGLSPRTTPVIPENIDNGEMTYIDKLIGAYSLHSGKAESIIGLSTEYADHLKRARKGFHYAEQLKNLFRDSLPEDTFLYLQDQVYDAIVFEPGKGYDKVLCTENKALILPLTSSPYSSVLQMSDRIGICHQLSNENKISWN